MSAVASPYADPISTVSSPGRGTLRASRRYEAVEYVSNTAGMETAPLSAVAAEVGGYTIGKQSEAASAAAAGGSRGAAAAAAASDRPPEGSSASASPTLAAGGSRRAAAAAAAGFSGTR